MSTKKKKIVIMGAGIGGLSCAHFLLKNKDIENMVADKKLDIHIIDKNDRIGGLARSNFGNPDKHSEICWKAFVNSYVCLFQVMNDIGHLNDIKPLETFFYYGEEGLDKIEFYNSFLCSMKDILRTDLLTWKDKYHIAKRYMKIWFACDERISTWDDVSWYSWFDNSTDGARLWAVNSTSIYLGMDYKNLSVHTIASMTRYIRQSKYADKHVFYSFNRPMQEVLNTWKDYLSHKGVKFHLNTEIESVHEHDNVIKKVYFTDETYLCGHIFVNSLNCDGLAHIEPSYIQLRDIGRQIQSQILFKLPYKKTPIDCKGTILIYHKSPWFLMARVEGTLWDSLQNIDTKHNNKYKDLLSVGIGMWDIQGFNGKTALECSPQELAEECWYQMFHNNDIEGEWDLWHTFQYDKENHIMTTTDPKFSNNVGTLALRPSAIDEKYHNLYHATAYTKTLTNTYHMESASEAGLHASDAIITEMGINNDSSIIEELQDKQKINWFTRFIRYIDSLIFHGCMSRSI